MSSFDLAFGLAQWRGVDGYGGATHYRKYALDPLLVTYAVAALTHNLILISTVHVLYGWHPLHLAKFSATADLGAREHDDQQSWAGHTHHERVLGGNVHVLGTPEPVVAQCMRLHAAGCDGVQVNFFDYKPDLEYFAARVLPLMQQAGLRTSAGEASAP